MDIIEAISLRKSIRGYKPDPVTKDIIKEILEIATRAPSAMNTQPWDITVMAGEALDKIKQANVERFDSGEAPPSYTNGRGFTGKYREHQITLGIQLFQLMGIAREDTEKRTEWMRKGFRFWDAPAVIILSTDESLTDRAYFDIGALAQTVTLTALRYGLGTCIQMVGIIYPDIIRKFTGIPESKRISLCLTIGYPDWDFPANSVHSEREPIENIVTWCDI